MKLTLILALLSMPIVSHAEGIDQAKTHVKAPHCKTIADVCKKAGFRSGDWKNGDGLWVYCMNPILGRPANSKAPALKVGLTVPTIAGGDVQACLSENPNIGMPKKK